MKRPYSYDERRTHTTITGALLRARKRAGGKYTAIIDADDRKLSYDDLVKATFALGSALAGLTEKRERVGVMLPTGAGAVIATFALSAYGRVPAMLNFTAGVRNLRSALKTGEIKRIVTAHQFIEKGGFESLIEALGQEAEIIYLEDVRDNLGVRDKAAALAGLYAPDLIRAKTDHDEEAVILFTSGTEGDPKGVALSHKNLVANVEQIIAHVPELMEDDIIYNPLPTFHCFGLTGGAFLPLFGGLTAAFHPSPLQTKEIAARIRDTNATILLATDTFVSQYARAGKEGDLDKLRFAVCGAERVRDETRSLLRRKFSVALLEGYGATEASPVVAVNPPADNRPGTVGTLLPGSEYKLEPVEGITRGGRLYLRGPNVMKGYILADAPGVIQPPEEGWHDTGDIVVIDDDGYITIRGRLKRFAKIGGEMVSLTVVENCASSLWPDNMHAAAAVPDGRKGEQIILITDSPDANRADLVGFIQNHGVPELAAPRKIIQVDEIPVLGTGKTDYGAVQRLAEAELAKAA